MPHFHRLNALLGWLVAALSAFVYIRTVEPTASFWDCSEFIATAHKLQVPHPPGAPLFLLVYRLFSLLSFGDVTRVAYWMNVSSALCSAATVLFLFWTIVLLGRKLLGVAVAQLTIAQAVGLWGAATVGALAYGFSDSAWFSATEAEVYAMSSLFTAFVVWAMLRWETITDESAATRWLLLIAYATGLSIGVHLLNLVTVPALTWLFYARRNVPTLKGSALAIGAGLGIVFALMIGVRIVLPTLAGEVEIAAVNRLGLPFGSGLLAFGTVFVGALVWGIRWSVQRQRAALNAVLLGFAFVLIGYSSYTAVLIRSNYNPPINENQPDNVLRFVYYLSLKQYPTRPLLYGPYFTAPVVDVRKGDPVYIRGKDRRNACRYEIADYERKIVFDPRQQTLFPRVHNRDGDNPAAYRRILGLSEGQKPTFGDNLRFLFTHQLGHMYARYFLWNFVGRESDREGAGSLLAMGGADVPITVANNPGRNAYYGLPLLLGLAGLLYQFGRNRAGFWLVGMLFGLLGVGLVLYLNTPPTEPRERDYIYVGSFYAFAIWIGLGTLAVASGLAYLIRNQLVTRVSAFVACLVVPCILADQNYDDHDRSGRFTAVDTAKNVLNACAPHAILFTNGDNDTFPLWYAQEVEGFRTDVRVVITGYTNFDWYDQQLKRATYRGAALPLSLEERHFAPGTNDQVMYVENPDLRDGINLPEYLRLLREDSPLLRATLSEGSTINTLPANRLILPVDVEAVRKLGIVPTEREPGLQPQLTIELPKGDIFKEDLIFLDILATNQWKRPIYFSSLANAVKFNLGEYTQLEGQVYRLLPARVAGARQGYVNSALMYRNLMEKSAWRGLDDPAVYQDDNIRSRTVFNNRVQFLLLAEQLLRENQSARARDTLLRCLAVMPDRAVPFDRISAAMITPLVRTGETGRAVALADTLGQRADETLAYYARQRNLSEAAQRTVAEQLDTLEEVAAALKAAARPEATRYETALARHRQYWQN